MICQINCARTVHQQTIVILGRNDIVPKRQKTRHHEDYMQLTVISKVGWLMTGAAQTDL